MAEGRRRHRRVRPAGSWDQHCDCPPGARRVPNPKAPPYARKWLCIADLPKAPGARAGGPRFVRARCNPGDGRDYRGLVAERQAQKIARRRPRVQREPESARIVRADPTQMELQLQRPKRKKRSAPVDWSKCKCPAGSELFVNKRNVRQCRRRTSGGAWAFVKASCP